MACIGIGKRARISTGPAYSPTRLPERGTSNLSDTLLGMGRLQLGNFALNFFKHMAVERELHFAMRTLHYIPFNQNLHWEFILPSAYGACYRQLGIVHRNLRFPDDQEYSVGHSVANCQSFPAPEGSAQFFRFDNEKGFAAFGMAHLDSTQPS